MFWQRRNDRLPVAPGAGEPAWDALRGMSGGRGGTTAPPKPRQRTHDRDRQHTTLVPVSTTPGRCGPKWCSGKGDTVQLWPSSWSALTAICVAGCAPAPTSAGAVTFKIGVLEPSTFPLAGGEATVVIDGPRLRLDDAVACDPSSCNGDSSGDCPCDQGDDCRVLQNASKTPVCAPAVRYLSLFAEGPSLEPEEFCPGSAAQEEERCHGQQVGFYNFDAPTQVSAVFPPADTAAGFDLVLYEGAGPYVEVARAENAGAYVALPASLAVNGTQNSFPAISPELMLPCNALRPLDPAEVGRNAETGFIVTNAGETATTLTASLESDHPFVFVNSCDGTALRPAESCTIIVCLEPSPPGAYQARVVVSGAGQSLELLASGEVLPTGDALDPTFGRGGAMFIDLGRVRGTATHDEGLFAGSFLAQTFIDAVDDTLGGAQRVSAAASFADGDVFFTSEVNASGCTLSRATSSGFVTSFGFEGVVDLEAAAVCSNSHSIAVASDRVFVSTPFQVVASFDMAGDVDSAFGDAGTLYPLPIVPSDIAADGSWLYVSDSVAQVTLRFSRTGVVDDAFSIARGGLLALDAEGTLFIAHETSVTRVAGASESTQELPAPASDIAVDANGRALIACAAGALRFDAAFSASEPVGLAALAARAVACSRTGPCFVVYDAALARLMPDG